jgi:hypothetical protein
MNKYDNSNEEITSYINLSTFLLISLVLSQIYLVYLVSAKSLWVKHENYQSIIEVRKDMVEWGTKIRQDVINSNLQRLELNNEK